MIKYPYPVLTFDGSSYKENISYELHYSRNFAAPGKLTFVFNIKLNSHLLKSMIENAEAKMFIKIHTGIFVGLQEVKDFSNEVECPVLLENIESNDIIRFTGYYGRKFTSRDSLVTMIEEYIEYYNGKRLQRNLGVLTPLEKHEQYYLAA